MNSSKGFKVFLAAGLLAALAMVPFVLQRGAMNQLRAENQRLQAQVAELTADVERASTNKARGNTGAPASSLSREQLHELMRLRAEVTALRQLTNGTGIVAAPVAMQDLPELIADQAAPPVVLTTNAPPWSNAGFAQPGDALNTMLWAMEQGRMDLVLHAATPEGQAELQQTYGFVNSPAETLQSEGKKIIEAKPSATYPPTEDEVYMTLVIHEPAQQRIMEEDGNPSIPAGTPYTLGAQRRESVVKLQKVGNGWRYAGKIN